MARKEKSLVTLKAYFLKFFFQFEAQNLSSLFDDLCILLAPVYSPCIQLILIHVSSLTGLLHVVLRNISLYFTLSKLLF